VLLAPNEEHGAQAEDGRRRYGRAAPVIVLRTPSEINPARPAASRTDLAVGASYSRKHASFSGTKIERRKRTGVPSRRIASAADLARALTAWSSRHPPSGVGASSV
jgi:hypothetical protein